MVIQPLPLPQEEMMQAMVLAVSEVLETLANPMRKFMKERKPVLPLKM